MWKLTITQERESKYTEGTLPEKLIVFSEDLANLISLPLILMSR